MANGNYSEGSPTPASWDGLWRYSAEDVPSSIEECRDATDSLWNYLENRYRVGSGDWDDLFLRGDYLGDRSQILEIVYPLALKPELFEFLHSWIAGQSQRWRIIIPTLLEHRDAFIVYPSGVRYRDFFGMPSGTLCNATAISMLKLKTFSHALERAVEDGYTI